MTRDHDQKPSPPPTGAETTAQCGADHNTPYRGKGPNLTPKRGPGTGNTAAARTITGGRSLGDQIHLGCGLLLPWSRWVR